MKKGFLIAGLLLLSFTLFTCASSQAKSPLSLGINYAPSEPDRENDIPVQPMSGKTAMEYFREEKIYSGFNIGNSLDANSRGEASETAWGNPRINQELMNGIKAAGFDIVRIPVTWTGHFGGEPDYRFFPTYLRRVSRVVEMANQAGLKAIINLHHDGAEGAGEVNWLSMNAARRSQEDNDRITFQFMRIWAQIAAYFKNYGDWLMFESCNEIHDGNWGNSGYEVLMPQFKILNGWNQAFVDVVRKSGGNNTDRYLIVPGYVTNARHTLGPNFILPHDSAADRLIVTFHYYDPYEFGIAGTRANWGSDADRKRTDDDFAPFKSRFIDNNIPVIIGECGAVLQLYPNDPDKEETARLSRREYLPHVYGIARKYELVPFYWDNGGTTGSGEKFGLINRRNGLPNSPESEFLLNAMVNAVKN